MEILCCKWTFIDRATAYSSAILAPEFREDQRFYRLKFREGCAIYDLKMQSIWYTTEEIFSPAFEKEFRNIGNDIRKLEAILDRAFSDGHEQR